VTCRELTSFIHDYLAGELATEHARRFDHHLTLCENCRRYLSQYRETIAAGRAAFTDPDATVPAEVPAELVRAILAARQR
jgi:anti-sigma factor RsiW